MNNAKPSDWKIEPLPGKQTAAASELLILRPLPLVFLAFIANGPISN
jgi:hypothetical protein